MPTPLTRLNSARAALDTAWNARAVELRERRDVPEHDAAVAAAQADYRTASADYSAWLAEFTA